MDRTSAAFAHTYPGTVWGPWSGIFTFRFRTPAASATTLSLVSLADGAAVEHPTPVLRWADSAAGQFNGLAGIAVDAQGALYFADTETAGCRSTCRERAAGRCGQWRCDATATSGRTPQPPDRTDPRSGG
ncbi:MAG: hypothetical protein NTZ05_14915 [Chloroflexi bacterium]|nr:hypothetical protein [Chloroflexota bacterium]